MKSCILLLSFCTVVVGLGSWRVPDVNVVISSRNNAKVPDYQFSKKLPASSSGYHVITSGSASPGEVSYFKAFQQTYPQSKLPWFLVKRNHGGFDMKLRVCKGRQESYYIVTKHPCGRSEDDVFEFFVSSIQMTAKQTRLPSSLRYKHFRYGVCQTRSRNHYSRITSSNVAPCLSGHKTLESGTFYAFQGETLCPELPAPFHGYLRSSEISNGVWTTSVTYGCEAGYLLVGTSTLRCSGGRWSTNPPSCLPTSCPTPPPCPCR